MFLVPLEIHQRETEGIVILDLKGRLNLGEEDSSLRLELQTLMRTGKKNVILNLRHVSHIDHAAVGSLAMIAQEFQKGAGRLALLNGGSDHAAVDELLKLGTTLPAYTDEQDAINSFFPNRKVPHYDVLQFVESISHPKPEPASKKRK